MFILGDIFFKVELLFK